jgi:hypothetical protein
MVHPIFSTPETMALYFLRVFLKPLQIASKSNGGQGGNQVGQQGNNR